MALKALSPRRLDYARYRLAGKIPLEAAKAAGYTGEKKQVWRLEHSEDVQAYIGETLERAGVTPELLAAKIKAGLDATVTETFLDKGDPRTGVPAKVMYSEPMEDHQTRHKFVHSASDLLGLTSAARRNAGQAHAPTMTTNILLVEQARSLSDAQLEELMQRRQAGLPVDHLLSAKASDVPGAGNKTHE